MSKTKATDPAIVEEAKRLHKELYEFCVEHKLPAVLFFVFADEDSEEEDEVHGRVEAGRAVGDDELPMPPSFKLADLLMRYMPEDEAALLYTIMRTKLKSE
jgi:hypothetical protein